MPDSSDQHVHRMTFRVRYSEIDRMGTFYNSRALDWFEVGRVEYLRDAGIPYDRMEESGYHLPLIEAHLEFVSRAGFDDLLEMRTTCRMVGKARVRFDIEIAHADEPARPVVRGRTVHAVTDRGGRPKRPADWLVRALTPTTEREQ